MAEQQSAKQQKPTREEIDAMTLFPTGNPECEILCDDYLELLEELQTATGIQKIRLIVRVRALSARMLQLKCPHCLPS